MRAVDHPQDYGNIPIIFLSTISDDIGVTFRTRSVDEVREICDEVRKDIWGAVESRKLQLPIEKVCKFDEIGKAFEHMEANRHLGKIVVTL